MPADLIAEWYIAVILIVVGLSHISSPRPWAQLFKDLLAKPYGGLVVGLLTLMPAVPLLAVHNIWEFRPPVIVTIVAWGQAIKGTLYLIWPAMPVRVAARHMEHPERFRIAGVVAVVLGGVVLAGLLAPSP